MRWLITLLVSLLIFTNVAYTQGFFVKSSYPNDGDYNVPASPNSVLIKFVFSEPVDTNRIFFNPDFGLPKFLGFLSFDPIDSVEILDSYVSSSADTIGIRVKLAPNTDYSIVLLGAYSCTGTMLEKAYVLNFTTSSTIGQWIVSGNVTLPSPRVLSLSKFSWNDVSNSETIKKLAKALSGNSEVSLLGKSHASLVSNFKVENLRPTKPFSVDPNIGVVALLDGNPFAEENVTIKYAAKVKSDLSFEIKYVRDGRYYLFAAFDTRRDGFIDPMTGDLIMFYDADNDGQPDSVVISGSNVTGLNLNYVYQARSFTVREKLDTVRSVARNYASDAKLRGIQSYEAFQEEIDGKVFWASYLFYSPSMNNYFTIYANAFGNIVLDTFFVPNILPNADLPLVFVDSDVVFDSAEANGGALFRSEPNTVTNISYDLRNYNQFDFLAPDTVNPYWRVIYQKNELNVGPKGMLIIYLNPSDGRFVSKFEITFEPVTAKRKFDEVNSLAMNYASDARLMYVVGSEDSLADGKCYYWHYGYESSSGRRFTVIYSYGMMRIDTVWYFEFPIQFTMPLNLHIYKDSDELAPIVEANGGREFKNRYPNHQQFYIYTQSPLDTSKIYFHGFYSGYDAVAGRMEFFVVLIDPVTGELVGSSPSSVNRDDGYGVPREFALYQNYPNPFNPTTTITYDIPIRSDVRLVVYNVLGQEVAVLVDEIQDAGRYSVRFDASGLPSGVYFYRLKAGKYVETKKMMIVK